MTLQENFESIILTKTGWNEKQSEFYGTLIYNIENNNKEPIADIICRRDTTGIILDWFTPNQEGEKISLSYVRHSNSLDPKKTDSEIKSEQDVIEFLNNIELTVKNIKSAFFPKEKIIQENKNKFNIV